MIILAPKRSCINNIVQQGKQGSSKWIKTIDARYTDFYWQIDMELICPACAHVGAAGWHYLHIIARCTMLLIGAPLELIFVNSRKFLHK